MDNEAFINKKFKNIRNLIIGLLIVMVGGMSGFFVSYGRTAKTVQHNEETINTLVREYVPSDFLYVMLKSYDLQDDYLLGLMNGQEEEARATLQEFRQFREDVFNRNFEPRGVILTPE